MKRRFVFATFPLIALIGGYFLGPSPQRPHYSQALPAVPGEPGLLEKFVADKESRHQLKPENHAEIFWADSGKAKTDYAVVYLHGFSASKREGDPIHRRFAREFGCNLYLARLADHGIDTTESLMLYTADRAWESAKEALVIGKQLGRKVILMSTSTGGTLALKLAAEYPGDVHALINMSPNVALKDGAAFLLNDPWGLHIARIVLGGNYRNTGASDEFARYWNRKYRIESLTQLEELVETTMTTETFGKITQPVLNMYYYKNEDEQDPEVSVAAILDMHEALGTPIDKKKCIAFPDAGAHVIGCDLTSKDLEGVYNQIRLFATEQLQLVPAGK